MISNKEDSKEGCPVNPTEITQLISTLGFPIVSCAALFWYMLKQGERHSEEVQQLKASLDNNTLAMTKLLDRIGVEEVV